MPRESETDRSLELHSEQVVHAVVHNIGCSSPMNDKTRSETLSDPCLKTVIEYIKGGWPEYKKLCNPVALIYWSIRAELVYFHGMVLYHDEIVIPKILQQALANTCRASRSCPL